MGTQTLHQVALIGIADDQGVLHVGGRLGAARGPAAFRTHWKRMRAPDGLADLLSDAFYDAGDLRLPVARGRSGIEASLDALIQAQSQAKRLLVIGGGNDHAWSQVTALKRAHPHARIGCINIDAHLDLRPLTREGQVTSGSPFRLLLEDGIIRAEDLVEFGIQRHCNAPELFEFARQKKVECIFWDDLRARAAEEPIAHSFARELTKLARRVDWVAVCLDLDAVSQSDAPGVSAPAAEGLSAREAVEMVRVAAQNAQVPSLGVYELNPDHDESGRTARLTATLAWHWTYAPGLANSLRPKAQSKKKLPKKSKTKRKSAS